ncbi:MAG: tRNA uracil 4-sulfurtransferase ThiI [Nanoarchaeota archaeon]
MYTHIVIHYGEIAIKGKNRPYFERVLIDNIKAHLKGLKYNNLRKISGRFILELNKDSNLEEIKNKLKNIFGISYFAFAINSSQDIEVIKKNVSKLIENDKSKTVRVLTKRSNKQFKINSLEMNKIMGEHLIKNHNLTIDLVDAELSIWIEIVEKYCFIYKNKIEGLNGLPIGVSGKVIGMLSGGIDSPVASYLMMKRGCKMIYIHFHSAPYTDKSSIEKVKDIIKLLNKYQLQSKLYLVPFIDIQKEIMTKTDKEYRVILYRRFMTRIAEIIARKDEANAIVTGEALGQVASQTSANLAVIEETVKIPILRPLIAKDKQEIIDLAIKIDTYEISILPHQDCCTLFIPKHPATKSDLNIIKKMEERLDVNKLINDAIKKIEKIII